jgi:BirA family biotin operon repressor/biotin-[acetyl-CoA-carboxylase] ligase
MSRKTTTNWDGHPLADLQERWGREQVILYGKIDSSNAAASHLADAGAPAGTIVLCREQTAGRGRAGHGWYSPRDAGLYLSLILRPGHILHPPLVSILAGLGVVERLEAGIAGLRPGLKWPNDLVASGRKLGGVLAEAAWSDSHPRHLVVGVGINVRPLTGDAPADVVSKATSIDVEVERSVPLVEVADAAISGVERWLPEPPPTLDGALLEQVDRYDWLRDRRAVLSLPAAEDAPGQPGTCVGIAPDGALLFRPDRGALRRVTDGVVDPWTSPGGGA